MSAFDFAVLSLATWRMASLITYERGPLRLFERVRSVVNIRHNDKGRPEAWPETFWGELLTCVWCLSPYIALILTLLYYFGGRIIVWVCLPFALSAASIVVNRFTR